MHRFGSLYCRCCSHGMCFEDLWRVIPSCHYTEEGNNDSSKRRNNAEVFKYLYRFLRKCSDCKRECKSKSYKYIRYSMSSISLVEILFCFFKHLYRVQYKSYHNFLFLRFDITTAFHILRGLLFGLSPLIGCFGICFVIVMTLVHFCQFRDPFLEIVVTSFGIRY